MLYAEKFNFFLLLSRFVVNISTTDNFFLLLSHFVVNISTTDIDKVVSMLFFQSRSNAHEHTLTQL